MSVITHFRGEYEFLCNFYRSGFAVEWEWKGHSGSFPAAENAYQVAKAVDLDEEWNTLQDHTPTIWRHFQRIPPGEAKRLGRKLDCRPDWQQIKIGVMESVLAAKFSRPHLQDLLVGTGDAELQEGNTWGDCFWGVYEGHGRNELGKALMRLRAKLQAEASAIASKAGLASQS